ncbi:hypothetical protein B7C62_20550 [Kitasatospora albolonga]|uniref:Uncharacterized protein n=1 Tax=Kitasatospora albolonga TaxID=68173 RepID=A0ABC8BVA7_9ACTN|nr:hypothetical protein B7C62_20550 [Kitasatospora albolonga]
MSDIAAYFNARQDLGGIGSAHVPAADAPLLATPATITTIAGWKAVGAFAAGAGCVVGAYTAGKANG